MSRKHYVAVADALAHETSVANVTRRLADLFEQDNPNFNRERFFAAAGLQEV